MPDLAVRLRLAAAWTALMFLYVYADLLSFFRPGELAEISAGNLIGESWAYYLFFGVLEIGLAGLVVAYSYRWRGRERPRMGEFR